MADAELRIQEYSISNLSRRTGSILSHSKWKGDFLSMKFGLKIGIKGSGQVFWELLLHGLEFNLYTLPFYYFLSCHVVLVRKLVRTLLEEITRSHRKDVVVWRKGSRKVF